MKIQTNKQAEKAIEELKQFYLEKIKKKISEAGGHKALSRKSGINFNTIEDALLKDSLVRMRNLYGRLYNDRSKDN